MSKKIKINLLSPTNKIHLLFILFFVITFLFHIFNLENFPIFHFDEPWMAERAYSLITTGKDITPSTNYAFQDYHGVYILMSYIQAISINFYGFTPFGIRLPSLIAFMISLLFWYYIFQLFFSNKTSLIGVVILSIQIPIVWAAHYARAEMFVICYFSTMSTVACYFFHKLKSNNIYILIFGFFCTLGIFLHLVALYIPFILGLLLFTILYYKVGYKKNAFVSLISFVLGTFLALLFYFFFVNTESLYFITFGDLAKVNKTTGNLIDHFLAFPTRYFDSLLNSKFHYLLIIATVFTGLIVYNFFQFFKTKNFQKFQLFLFAITSYGLIHIFLSLMGRSSNTYFVNLYPFQIFVFLTTLQPLKNKVKYIIVASFLIVSLSSLLITTRFHNGVDTNDYIQNLRRNIAPNATVLGNELTMLAFKESTHFKGFYDIFYSNLFGRKITFVEYLKMFNVRYVVLSKYAYQWKKSVLTQYQNTTGLKKSDFNKILNFSWVKKNCKLANSFIHKSYHSKYYEKRRFPHYGVLWTLFEDRSSESKTEVYDCLEHIKDKTLKYSGFTSIQLDA